MKKFTLFFLVLIGYQNCFAEGNIVNKSFMHGDSLRTYILYVPADYDGTENWPLVLNLHGYTGTSELQMLLTNMNVVADTAHFLVAYPQGLLMKSTVPGLPPQGFGWNSSEDGDTNYVSAGNADDVSYIRQVIDQVENEYAVNPERVYATGFSGGAFMCFVLACELEDKIAAIAPVGGMPRIGRACNLSRPVPVLQIHGTKDPMVNYSGFPPLVISVEETLEVWLDQNNCDGPPVLNYFPDINTNDSSTVEVHQWNNCEAELVHLKVIGGGHQWPGGTNLFPTYFGNMNQDINASAEIWKFFKKHKNTSTFSTASNQNPIIPADFKVYPNPAVDYITLEFDFWEVTTVNLQLVNSFGQLVANTEKNIVSAGHQRMEWQLPNKNITNGLYFLIVTFNKEQVISKSVMIVAS